jgi:membrane-bound lytic murein transglycosylase D
LSLRYFRRPAALLALVVSTGLGSACAHSKPAAPALTPASPVSQTDPHSDRIAQADALLATGLEQVKAGHLNAARKDFDAAVELFLTAPGGALASPKLAEAYRRTLDTVHLSEIEALAAGDGFTEARTEPASIDQVGAIQVDALPASESVRRTAEEVVREERNDFPVELNDAVLGCIDLYQGRLRDWFEAALARGGRYLPRIREVFKEEGLPQDLAYLALVESAFHTNALSRAKAKGMWQFIAATGRRYGLNQDWWVDDRADPEKATRAAARYLKDLYEMFGDWNLAMAGYNAGEGRVSLGLERYKVTDFWSLAKTRGLRAETKNYVPLIHAAIVVAKAPTKYGFEVDPETLPASEAMAVNGAVDLRFLSECAGATLDQIQLLNPSLRRLATPAGRTFHLRVPQGTAEATAKCLAATPPEKRVQFRTHTVTRGQTLATIAAAYGVKTADLASANTMQLKRRLAVGTELIIPIDPRAAAARAARPGPPAPVRSADLPQTAANRPRISYRVKPGDTLARIASQFGTTIQSLQSWNGLRGSRIVAGDSLTIFTN